MSKQDQENAAAEAASQKGNPERSQAEVPVPAKPRRKRVPKDEAKQVSTSLDDDLRTKLLALNKLHQKQAMVDLPLSATLAYAIHLAHDAVFGGE